MAFTSCSIFVSRHLILGVQQKKQVFRVPSLLGFTLIRHKHKKFYRSRTFNNLKQE